MSSQGISQEKHYAGRAHEAAQTGQKQAYLPGCTFRLIYYLISDMSELTPLMKQYTTVKEQYPDAIVFFRLGDFYEMFGEDAEKASRILQIALTSRDKSSDNPMPMCGVPYFASETYIAKLIKAGLKVAVCEQMQEV